jgi:hypothetical protein
MDQNPAIYRFDVMYTGDVPDTIGVYPVYDDNNRLVGGFTVLHSNIIRCFVSGQNHSAALAVSTEQLFWFTPIENCIGKITSAVISEVKTKPYSINVSAIGNHDG